MLAEYFNVSVDYLLGDNSDKTNTKKDNSEKLSDLGENSVLAKIETVIRQLPENAHHSVLDYVTFLVNQEQSRE